MTNQDDIFKNAFKSQPEVTDSEMELIMQRSLTRGKRRRVRSQIIGSSAVVITLVGAVAIAGMRNSNSSSVANGKTSVTSEQAQVVAPSTSLTFLSSGNDSIVKVDATSGKQVAELVSVEQLKPYGMAVGLLAARDSGTLFVETTKDNGATALQILSIDSKGVISPVVQGLSLLAVDPAGTRILYAGEGTLADGSKQNALHMRDLASGKDVVISAISADGVAYLRASGYAFSDDGSSFSALITSKGELKLSTFKSMVPFQSLAEGSTITLPSGADESKVSVVGLGSYAISANGKNSTSIKIFRDAKLVNTLKVSRALAVGRVLLDKSGTRALLVAENGMAQIGISDANRTAFKSIVVDVPGSKMQAEKMMQLSNDNVSGGWLPSDS